MIVELISVGTELLLGNIVNTNAQFLSEQCAYLGLDVYFQTVVGDNEERLSMCLSSALTRSDIVILTGGLGPTQDDLTKEVCAQVMNVPLIDDLQVKAAIEDYGKQAGRQQIPESNWKQAKVFEDGIVLENKNGTAPGLILKKNGKTLILLPGPPEELRPMFFEQVIPHLTKDCSEVIYSQMIKVCGAWESEMEESLQDLINEQSNPTIATYGKVGEVHLRVTAKAESKEVAKQLCKPMVKEIKHRFSSLIYSTNQEETLAMVVVKLLKKHELTVTTVESCTGGLLAGAFTSVSGISEVFREGLITYSNKSKKKYLDVKKNTLKKYGAVSSQTAKEMAKGGVFATDCDLCIAVTGIAGPEGGTPEKPVGLVYIACYMKDKVSIEEWHLNGNRQKIREQTVIKALDLVRRCILHHYD